MRAYLGAATQGGDGTPAAGIGLVDVDGPDVAPVAIGATEAVNPMYLALAPADDVLYAVHESTPGLVSAWRIQGDTLRPAGEPRMSGGDGPCHVSAHPSGRFVLVANYGSGTVAVLPVRPDGSLEDPSDVAQHSGAGPDLDRQAGPHAHMIVTDPAGDVLACDLGTDEVRRYGLDEATGRLRPRDPLVMPAGSGPRHLVVDGRYAYVVGELDSTVSVVDLDAERVVETVSTQPTARTAPSHPSAIRLSPDGRFLYVANRGPDVVAVLAVERTAIELIGTVPSGGTHPRDLALHPMGTCLYVANQHSDTISAFRIDPASGLPEPQGQAFSTPSPTCIVFG